MSLLSTRALRVKLVEERLGLRALRGDVESRGRELFLGLRDLHARGLLDFVLAETIADVVTISEDDDGKIDLAHLERELSHCADRPLKIGSFSAASNVTGVVSDTHAFSALLHRHSALSFWDYAAAGANAFLDCSSHTPIVRR